MSASRDLVWNLRCGADRCPYRRRNGGRVSIGDAASRHARKFPGHNVIISYSSPEGETFHNVILVNDPQMVYAVDEPPF
jgi:hypothetical protein